MITALSGQDQRAEHDHQQQEREDQHGADDDEEAVAEEVGGVDAGRRLPAHLRVDGGAAATGGMTSLRSVCDERSVWADWGDVVGIDDDHGPGTAPR